jgi:hypothetical protein
MVYAPRGGGFQPPWRAGCSQCELVAESTDLSDHSFDAIRRAKVPDENRAYFGFAGTELSLPADFLFDSSPSGFAVESLKTER